MFSSLIRKLRFTRLAVPFLMLPLCLPAFGRFQFLARLLAYQVTALGSSSPVFSNSVSAKASADGEDIISPLIEQEATAIMAQLTKKN